jgi:glycosyltransferase involved in cell wall biosynthesis
MKPSLGMRFKLNLVSRFVLRRLDRIGVVSMAKLNKLLSQFRLNPKRLDLIYNSVDLERFKNLEKGAEIREIMGIPPENKIIGMVGRLVREKAYDIFLKSAKKITENYPDARFLIIGDGRERPALETLAEDLGIARQVMFLGEREDAAELISLFDVAVLSSRSESFPLVILEYMASMKPIVSTNVGGIPEIIRNGESGILVPPEDPEALSKKTMELLSDSKLAGKIALKAKQEVEIKFSMKNMMGRMERFFAN